MKIQSLIIAILLLGLEACDKKNELPTIEELGYWGTFTATINGKDWAGAPFTAKNQDKGFVIGADSLDKYLIKRASLSFTKVPCQPGTSPLTNTFFQTNDGLIGAQYYILDDDVIFGNYKVLESDSSSFITLMSYDTISRELKGTFDITFIVDHRPNSSYPDTIRFRNGKFHTRLKD